MPDEASIPPTMLSETTYAMPAHGWTCFHCGETFMAPGAARAHFGADPFDEPGCRIKFGDERRLLMALRRAQTELARYRAEDSDVIREMHGLLAEHARALIREEEKGYARGLRDGLDEAIRRIREGANA